MRRLGTIDQLGYVVDDVTKAMTHWVEVLGVGPFFFLPRPALHDLQLPGRAHRGPHRAWRSAMRAPTQVELIEPLDDHPSPYGDFRPHPGAGLHHVARFVDDYDAAIAEWASDGLDPCFVGRALSDHQRFCYFDTAGHGGTVCELIEVAEFAAFFDHIRDQSARWDGSEPVRTVGG